MAILFVSSSVGLHKWQQGPIGKCAWLRAGTLGAPRRARLGIVAESRRASVVCSGIQKADDEFYYAGALPAIDETVVAETGVKSVLYLTTDSEPSYSSNHAAEAEALGLEFQYVPVAVPKLDSDMAETLKKAAAELPKPCLVACASGKRASALISMVRGTEEKLGPEETIEKATAEGMPFTDMPPLRSWVAENV